MAYEFLNETTFTKDLAQQEELLHQIQDRMLPRTEPAEYDDTPLDTDIVEILEQEDTEEEPEKEPVDQNDSFDFEQEDMTNDDMEILGFLFQKPSRSEGAGTMTSANGAVSHINSEPMSLGWVKTKSPKVNISNVGSPISKYLESLPQNLRERMVATSGNDQQHAKGSRHYQNKAIDLRYDKELYDYINNDPNRKKYGLNLLNPNHGTAPHIHLDYQYGGDVLNAISNKQLKTGLNDPNYNSAVLNLQGTNTIRGLDNKQPVAVTDGTKYKILRGPDDTEVFKGNVYETRL